MIYYPGDRVVAVSRSWANVRPGDTGTVLEQLDDASIAVRWDRYVGGHSCKLVSSTGMCEDGYGTYVYPRKLRPLNNDAGKEADMESVTYCPGDRVVAVVPGFAEVKVGDTGTVLKQYDEDHVAIRWDRYVKGHMCLALSPDQPCENGHGTYQDVGDVAPLCHGQDFEMEIKIDMEGVL